MKSMVNMVIILLIITYWNNNYYYYYYYWVNGEIVYYYYYYWLLKIKNKLNFNFSNVMFEACLLLVWSDRSGLRFPKAL